MILGRGWGGGMISEGGGRLHDIRQLIYTRQNYSGQVAQLVNHRLCNREVAGSNPTACLVVG